MDNKPVYNWGRGGTMRRRCEYALDVQPPDGGPIFRTTVLSPLNVDSLRDLAVGEVVPVLFHAKERKVKFDTSDRSMSQAAAKDARRARFEAVALAAPSASSGGPTRDLPNPKADIARRAIEQAKRNGDTAAVERMTAWLAELEASGAQDRPTSPDATGGESIQERLAKLQQLRDEGLLTPDEYSVQRQRILDAI